MVLRRARERAPTLARATGVDVTPSMLAIAGGKAEGAELIESDAADLPFEDGAFDVATCQQGLQFFSDPAAALRELKRVLAPGGRAVLACWCTVDTQPAFHALVRTLETHAPENVPAALAPFGLCDGDAMRPCCVAPGSPRSPSSGSSASRASPRPRRSSGPS